jgi:hypothetical protein
MKTLLIALLVVISFASCSKSVTPPVEASAPVIKTFTVGKDSTITISVGVYNGYVLGMVKTSFPVGNGYKTGIKVTDSFSNSQSFLIDYSVQDNHQGHFTGENYLYGLPSDFKIFFEVNGVITYINAKNPEPKMKDKR